MEQVYAVGISVIQFLQDDCADWQWYFDLVNRVMNPLYAFRIMLPVVATVDSVFAAQFLLCMSFGTWLNAIMKWWLLEDRPYWWIRETSFYTDRDRPALSQYNHTCETGPGNPSGHSNMASMEVMLLIMWMAHVMNDRKCYVWWWKVLVYPACGVLLVSTMLARMFEGAHFPHQCLLGAFIGLFVAPALCIYVSDPYIWDSKADPAKTQSAMIYHTTIVLMLIAISFITYWTLKVCGVDPQWTVKLAFRWCEDPNSICVMSAPLFALVQSTASLLGWALCVTPTINKYRYYTTPRSLLLASFATLLTVNGILYLQQIVPKHNVVLFYCIHFLIYAVYVPLLLRLVPLISTWPCKYKAVRRWILFKWKLN